MPTRPKIVTLTNSSVDVLNAIRNSASTNYRDYVPIATPDADSIREIGAVIMDYPSLQNEFLNALINRIGRVLITSKTFSNPWNVFKKGLMEFGETVEEVFVNIAKPFQYDPAVAETDIFKREIPDVRSAFHIMNWQKYYKSTIQNEQLRQAFLSWDGITDLIARIVDSMYTALNYDEFQTMKYMLAKHILSGNLYPVQIPEVNADNARGIVSAIKGISNSFTFMSNEYNRAGVASYTNKDDQYLIVNSNFDAIMGVEVLATAFNMDKAEFSGHVILVDNFGNLDIGRLGQLFYGDTTYTEFSQDELNALNQVPAVLVSRDWFMIFDNLYKFTENYNGEGMYWQYWLHAWKTFSVSPFSNAAVFVPGVASVTGVTVNPSTVNTSAGQTISFSATVETENFAPQEVTWSVDSDNATVSSNGVVNIAPEATAGEIVVTARSVYDSTKTGTATITVA